MNKLLFILFFIGVGLLSGNCLAEAPNQVGGFQLGADISTYKDRVDMNSALPIRYAGLRGDDDGDVADVGIGFELELRPGIHAIEKHHQRHEQDDQALLQA